MEGRYIGYTKDVDTDTAAALFEARRGYSPAKVLDGGPIWLAGPLKIIAAEVGIPPSPPNAGEEPEAASGEDPIQP